MSKKYKFKDDILRLRSEGMSYGNIVKELGCSKTVVCYHCGEGQKVKYNARSDKSKKRHPYIIKINNFIKRKYVNNLKSTALKCKNWELIRAKIDRFHYNKKTKEFSKMTFKTQDVIDKFGENPKCYLTGRHIDIYNPRTYQFDHIVPTSKGGDNTLDNLGICTKEANMSKTDHTLEEFLQLCKEVLENYNYKVEKITE